MRRQLTRLTFFALLLVAFPCNAIDEAILIDMVAKEAGVSSAHVREQWFDGCSSGITNRMIECSYFRRIGTDIELAETYKEILAKLETAEAKKRLRGAQSAWIAFREESCAYENLPYEGERTSGVFIAGCRTEFSQVRIEQLKKYLQCRSSDCTR